MFKASKVFSSFSTDDIQEAKRFYSETLGVIPDISQNNGLVIVISNSAADKLGAGDSNFSCTVSFAKNQ